ncbi:predicted protein [Naegleria gruberi]|uniref:Predicted protein n=1 Tax=Naegleria gruberi TaxID=5762 RepID=D2W1Q3_NAEGR|nr:uncharacterized protein NAEGRDRAFT_54034 [Naegleria gruberi]EFC37004.1 predicted protein [Naegleria gruberi]|eukprot:XP_002669748.1 predicted protein [Naegleria gruberi strain NEG-M]
MVDTNSNVMKSMIKELKSKDDDAFNKSAESIEVQEGLKCLEMILNPIVHSDLSFSQKMEYFDMIRSEILKQSARKAHNLFLFEESWLNRDFNINIDETMFQQLKSKLKYYTIHEAYYIGFTEYIQEERFFATAVFELANGKLTEISLKHEMLYAFTEEERDTISLEIDGQEEDSTIPQLIENILGIDLEKVDDEMEIIQNFCKCLLKLVGKCHRINITESTEMTFTLKYFPKPIKEAVEQLSDL